MEEKKEGEGEGEGEEKEGEGEEKEEGEEEEQLQLPIFHAISGVLSTATFSLFTTISFIHPSQFSVLQKLYTIPHVTGI